MTIGWPVAPMKAVLGTLPHDDGGWAYEIKWDGWRVIVHVADGSVRVQSASGHDITATYPELAELAGSVNAERAVLDGELVVLDDQARPNFGMLQAHSRPAVFAAFDLLSVNGTDTIALPYEQRRALLVDVLEPGPHWMVPAHHIGGGADLLAVTDEQGLEGIIAKRLGTTYQPGTRAKCWIKIKHRRRVVVTVGGWRTGTGNRASTFGALLVGLPDDGRLRFAGGVGTGFTQQVLKDLRDRLAALHTDECPFDPPPPRAEARGAHWVRPGLHAEIEIAEFTNDGHVRHASFLGLVPDSPT
jgi:bifunctional non-homologous end joining protein LigD